MSIEKLPKVIDPSMFKAGLQQSIVTIPVTALKRLNDIAQKRSSDIQLTMRWGKNTGGVSIVSGELQMELVLQCQRCLGEYLYHLDRSFSLPIEYRQITDEETVLDKDEKLLLQHGEVISTLELIEDEILLSIPLHPRHADISACDQNMLSRKTEYKPDSDEVKKNPFTVLKHLKSLE